MTNRREKEVEVYSHDEASRRNIPTAEYQPVMADEDKTPIQVAYERRNRDLDPQLVWRGKDAQDWSDLVVQAPPLYIQEKIHPKAIIDDLKRRSAAAGFNPQSGVNGQQLDLFADFNGLPEGADSTDFYHHEGHWSNRMILGDSLQVMASLAEREGLRGKVQCIYIDPPYGIKFNSNFQWSTTSRDVRDGNAEHITREPEQVKAFRDTWRDGIHSYLTYLRDRLTIARDLLSESGSVFVQIGDENVHRVRSLMDEVFGEENFASQITFAKTSGQSDNYLAGVVDHIIWFARDRARLKYRQLYRAKRVGEEGASGYNRVEERLGLRRGLTADERRNIADLPAHYRIFTADNLTSQSPGTRYKVLFEGREYYPTGYWKTEEILMPRLRRAERLASSGNNLRYVRFLDDFPVFPFSNSWTDTGVAGFAANKQYVVETAPKVIERCLVMASDPGDLVLDPTCGSGTTAFVSEEWGRRWITIDTSRVALALARARIMGARYPYFHLADSPEGQQKEVEIARAAPSTSLTHCDIRQGFVYDRVAHIQLSDIANNAEIDVIWEQYQETLEPLRTQLSKLLGKSWEEWGIPREAEESWPDVAKSLHARWWEQRIARQKEIDASIAAHAEFEYLYDKPYVDNRKVRVAGPFTVESMYPHSVAGVDEDGELMLSDGREEYGEVQDFASMVLEQLRMAGVQHAHKEDKIDFVSLTPWPGHHVCAAGVYDDSESGTQKRAGILIGPEFGTVTRVDLVEAVKEAGDAGFDLLIACAFNYDAHSTEFNRLGRIPVLKARMNADLHMAGDLKNTGKGNLFVVFGEPDIEVVSGQWLVASSGRLVAHFDSAKELSGLGSLDEINRLGGSDLQGFKQLSKRGALRANQPTAAGSSVGTGEHRGGGGEDGDRGVPPVPERGERLAGGGRDVLGAGGTIGDTQDGGTGTTAGSGERDQQNAGRTQALAAIETLTASDFPLSLSTSHYAQVTLRGVDVFHPSTGEVRSDGPEGIACWFIDTDYNQESFFVRHAYFLGANDPYKSLKTTLKAEIDEDAWESLHSDTSRPFDKPESGRIAVKVINHLGDEVMKVFRV
jgi:adenine-specific DNA-methyltransferase